MGKYEAAERIARSVIPGLIKRVAGRFPKADPELVFDAVVEALLNYLSKPKAFDSRRGVSLEGFLALAARRNLQDLLSANRRRKAREGAFAALWVEQRRVAEPGETMPMDAPPPPPRWD